MCWPAFWVTGRKTCRSLQFLTEWTAQVLNIIDLHKYTYREIYFYLWLYFQGRPVLQYLVNMQVITNDFLVSQSKSDLYQLFNQDIIFDTNFVYNLLSQCFKAFCSFTSEEIGKEVYFLLFWAFWCWCEKLVCQGGFCFSFLNLHETQLNWTQLNWKCGNY